MHEYRHAYPIRWLAAAGMLAVLVALVFAMAPPAYPRWSNTTDSGALIRWRDARHDWLVVADGAENRVQVYDARSGRLMRHLDPVRGVRTGQSLLRRDGRLYLVDDAGAASELELPSLTLAMAANRTH